MGLRLPRASLNMWCGKKRCKKHSRHGRVLVTGWHFPACLHAQIQSAHSLLSTTLGHSGQTDSGARATYHPTNTLSHHSSQLIPSHSNPRLTCGTSGPGVPTHTTPPDTMVYMERTN